MEILLLGYCHKGMGQYVSPVSSYHQGILVIRQGLPICIGRMPDECTWPDGGAEPDEGTWPDGGVEPDIGMCPDAGAEPDEGTWYDGGAEPDEGMWPDEHVAL
ncbi:hypothetical protein Rs2_28486 [Raphanus sativus]|nr:hypothetical protein Rs2_28486 [Raphanus sativus]